MRKLVITVGAIGALAFGGVGIANAAPAPVYMAACTGQAGVTGTCDGAPSFVAPAPVTDPYDLSPAAPNPYGPWKTFHSLINPI